MSRPGEFYRHSGKFSPLVALWLAVIGGLGVAASGTAYGYLVSWNPIIYLNLLAFIGYALLAGVLAALVTHTGKVRNSLVALLVGAIVGAFAVYAMWVAWVHSQFSQKVLVFDPFALWNGISVLAQMGVWEIKGTTPTGGALWTIWGIEAGCVFLGGLIGGVAGISDEAFDEETGEWASETHEIYPLEPILDPKALIERMKVRDWDSLIALRKIDALATSYTKMRLRWNPSGTFFVVALRSVSITTDKDGNVQTSESGVVDNMVIDQETFSRLSTEAGKTKFADNPGELGEAQAAAAGASAEEQSEEPREEA